MKKLQIFIALLLLSMSSLIAQNASDYDGYLDSLVITQGTEKSKVFWALDTQASDGLDAGVVENEGPPAPPSGLFARLPIPGSTTGLIPDVRNYTSFPFTGSHTLTLEVLNLVAGNSLTIDFPAGIEAQLTDKITGTLFNETLSGSASVELNPALGSLNLILTFTNFTPPAAPNALAATPASLNFNGVPNGTTADLQVTVNNTGATDLDITGVNLPAGYTIAPNTYPITIAASGNVVFDVTFAPTAAQNYNGDIEFVSTQNLIVPVTGFGQAPGPTFSANPTSLVFGDVAAGGSSSLTITVTNQGASNPMSLTNVTSDNTEFIVAGTLPATIAPGASEVYTITFTPLGGAQTGNITFTHDAPTSPDVISVSGTGVVGSKGTFYFSADSVVRVDRKDYTDSLGLNYIGSDGLFAVEFKFKTNGRYTIDEVRLGSAIPDAQKSNWNFLTNIVRGPLSEDLLTTVDEINILLYGKDSTVLIQGDYPNLFEFDYYVADLFNRDTAFTTLNLTEVYGSLVNSSSVETVPAYDTLLTQVIEIRNSSVHGSKGDVNGDGTLNILDLLDVVDHILEIRLLQGSRFERADIAPWGANDGVVNVQDLALIQRILLDGEFPDGVRINGLAKAVSGSVAIAGSLQKSNLESDVKLTTYVNKTGISVVLENRVPVRGVQLEYDKIVTAIDESLNIDTELGDVYYKQIQRYLRVLVYDNSNKVILEPGKHSLLSIPVEIEDIENVKLEKYIIASLENQAIEDVEIEFSYEEAPVLPVEYSLAQNYPNPFNPTTNIEFSIPEKNNVSLIIYNLLGQEVRTLFIGQMERGKMVLNWNGTNNHGSQVPSGMYIVRMSAGNSDFVSSKKMMFLK